MKPEWVTDNVKRAWIAWWTHRHPQNTDAAALAENADLDSDLQEALDLLHFAAEQAGVHTRSTIDRPNFFWVDSWKEIPFVDEETPMSREYLPRFTQENSESLLHAILLAIDAIVAHKPEAFA